MSKGASEEEHEPCAHALFWNCSPVRVAVVARSRMGMPWVMHVTRQFLAKGETYLAKDQVHNIVDFFKWTDAVKRSTTVMKAVQMC
jgi:hypothetical protein